ncbi:baseplate J/gp47 family protein [Polyangium sp. y55x31]|uniref:baseplate J/gp47 family protein n=1 Tax=Polyangium sp. y55x31 TaxID=3042688 RepID=UPI002482C4E0|nr:baseplate J/gp47 family protein [Polyangium sp. y55x31]MDI1478920.1 baseplate J/gp47 family protein [Polyangium sp. y55x31]
MSREDIVQNMVSELGQSQGDREAPELEPGFVEIDERSPVEMAAFAEALSKIVRFHGLPKAGGGAAIEPDRTFEPFFRGAAGKARRLLAKPDGNAPPHLALFLSFLALREDVRALVNRLRDEHHDFHFRHVLGFEPRQAVPDRAYVVVELKKNAARTSLLPAHELTAGKDESGVEQIYVPVREVVVSAARVAEKRSVYVDRRGHGVVRCAPVADSLDGMGAPLPEDASWRPFGSPSLQPAELGFALASPILRMAEGRRGVKLTLEVGGASFAAASLTGVFQAYLTGAKGWIGPLDPKVEVNGASWVFSFELPEGEAAVVDYDAKTHGGSWAAEAPILELLLVPGAALGHEDLKSVQLSKARIVVDVARVRSLVLESDAGKLDPKKPFLPFGPQPEIGSRFTIGCAEALSKKLTKLHVHVEWQGLPASFATHYANYGSQAIDASFFRVKASFQDATGGGHPVTSLELFPTDGVIEVWSGAAQGGAELSRGRVLHALRTAGVVKLRDEANRITKIKRTLHAGPGAAPEASPGAVTFSIERGYFLGDYRKKMAENIAAHEAAVTQNLVDHANDENVDLKYTALVTLAEPYTPKLRSISLDYAADTGLVDIGLGTEDAFASPDVQFFHVDCFGTRREHGYLRSGLSFVADKQVPLLPPHPHEGELLLGLTGVSPGDSVSLLFRVAEGSADPDVQWPAVQWSVLSNNQWCPLGAGEIERDTTQGTRRSGLVVVSVPRAATTEGTLLPAGRIWLRAVVDSAANGVSALREILANGVEVVFSDRGNDPTRLAAPLPSGRITRFKAPVVTVKKVIQPDASFGGREVEPAEALRMRASERLRHKNRAVTPWDYERLVLDAFPSVHKVKCVPHANDASFLAPGHVLVIVVPDLRRGVGGSPLAPRVDFDTRESIRDFLQARTGVQVVVHVKNPAYQRVQIECKVAFRGGDFNMQKAKLEREIIEFMSPWAFDAARPISFGGRVYRSVLLDFVEERPYVDYVTNFAMYTFDAERGDARDVVEARAARPDTILVSAETHGISKVG